MVRLRPATIADVDSIGEVLADAFLDDPGAVIFEPERDRRAEILPAFFRTWVAAALADGGDLVVPDQPGPPRGVASWFGPDRHGPSGDAMAAAGMADVLEAFGPAAADRMLAMVSALEREHDRLAPGPHLRLDFFGVRPDAQGTGLGTSLLEHGHARGDRERLPCYLETFTRRNVEYYERRGWDVVERYTVADAVPVYAMIRPVGD